LTLSSDSDVMYALTSYINADPDARAWLDGQPDPWGMTVNPAYLGIQLPTQSWPLLDSFKPDYPAGFNPCLNAVPVPYLPLVAAPTERLFSIGQDMQFAIAQSQTSCSSDPSNPAYNKLVALGRQQVGARFMLGTVSLGDAAREGLQLAELETQKAPDAANRFTNADGRSFVGPTTDGLRNAAQLATPNSPLADASYWTIPYRTLRTDPAGAAAYPGTMIVYEAAPTTGLASADAHNIATLMRYASADLQTPGSAPGKLPPGYLPMTAANGLGSLVNYAEVAANAVAAQKGGTPSLYTVLPTPPSSPPSSGTASLPPSGPSGGTGTSAPAPGSPASIATGATPTSGGPARPTSSGAPSSPALTQAAFRTPSWKSNGALLLPVLAGIVVIFGAAVVAVRRVGRRGGHT
jgi:hypothetical protein